MSTPDNANYNERGPSNRDGSLTGSSGHPAREDKAPVPAGGEHVQPPPATPTNRSYEERLERAARRISRRSFWQPEDIMPEHAPMRVILLRDLEALNKVLRSSPRAPHRGN